MGRVGDWVAWIFVLTMVSCSEVFVILGGGGGSVVKGMSQRPFELRLPVMTIIYLFSIFNWYLEKIATQSSSQNCPMETNDPFFRLSNKKAYCALSVNLADKGIFASECGGNGITIYHCHWRPGFTCMLVQTCFAPACT